MTLKNTLKQVIEVVSKYSGRKVDNIVSIGLNRESFVMGRVRNDSYYINLEKLASVNICTIFS